MRTIQYIIAIILLVTVAACGNMDEINTNTDKSTQVPAEFLSLGLTLNMTQAEWAKNIFQEAWIIKTMSFTEHPENYLYNVFLDRNFDDYHNLLDADKMEDFANANVGLNVNTINPYRGVRHFVRAFVFYNATMALGDVPCTEAAIDGIKRPEYDSQEKVFGTIIRELEQASDFFALGINFSGDVIYNGNAQRWHKLANSFMLRVLIQLYSKTTVDGIDVKQKFAEFAKKPLMENNDDNMQRYYSDRDGQRYPYNKLQQNWRIDAVMGKFLVDKMKELNDYRLFYYAEPAPALIDKYPANSFDAYSGVDVTAPFSDVQAANSRGLHSRNNDRYIYDPVCEPTAVISSAEVQFILAEAALRGWISSSPKTHYEQGVALAMNFTAKYTKEEYRHGITIDNTYIASYLAGEAAYRPTATVEQQLEQIIWQKFIASHIQLRLNPYFDYRRTGYPRIPINPATNLNRNPNTMPMRWMYSGSEAATNSENLKKALEAQYGGEDYPTGIMWVLK